MSLECGPSLRRYLLSLSLPLFAQTTGAEREGEKMKEERKWQERERVQRSESFLVSLSLSYSLLPVLSLSLFRTGPLSEPGPPRPALEVRSPKQLQTRSGERLRPPLVERQKDDVKWERESEKETVGGEWFQHPHLLHPHESLGVH